MPDQSHRETGPEIPVGVLEPGDLHRFQAVLGWLELGNPGEALLELNTIRPASASQPLMLELAYQVHSACLDWAGALTVALKLKSLFPGRSAAWLHESYALRRAPGGGVPQALEALSPALALFPEEPTIPYNLACYSCVMGNHEAVFPLLEKAMNAGMRDRILSMALADRDFEPLWGEIQARWAD